MANYVRLGVILLVFVLGLYFSAFGPLEREGYLDKPSPPCPDLLLEENRKFYLYNSKLARVPGVNPVVFDTLEDYVEFLEWQRGQGVRCKVQHLRKVTNAQGESVYRFVHYVDGRDIHLDAPPTQPSRLVDAGRNEAPYNQNSFPSFDPQDQYVGTHTPLDKMFNADEYIRSVNPMDGNWGGHEFTVDNVPQIKEREHD